MTIFLIKGGGGGLPNPKNPYQKKLRRSNRGERGSQFIDLKGKKKNSFYASPNKAKLDKVDKEGEGGQG